MPARRRRDPLHSLNVGIGSALVSAGWGIASTVAHMPTSVSVTGVSVAGGLAMWQAVKAKVEAVREERAERRKSKG